MVDKKKPEARSPRTTLVQTAVIIIILVVGLACLLFGTSGTWPSMVAVESDSMCPNLNVGDLVFIVQKDRLGEILTTDEAKLKGEKSLGGYGDVIVYNPNGNTHTTAFIHRVVDWIEEEEAVELYGFSPDTAHSGYITKGDNNNAEDQTFAFNGIGRVYPVQDEWIVGKAVFAIPFLGFLPIYIWQIAVIVLILLLVYEWYSRRADKKEKAEEAARLNTETDEDKKSE